MLPSRLYKLENVVRARYARMVCAGLAAVICAYLLGVTALDFRGLMGAESALASQEEELARLQGIAGPAGSSRAATVGPNSGVEEFAARVSRWARARNLKMESLQPKGAPADVDVKVDGEDAGKWKTSQVGMIGRGQLDAVRLLIDEFRSGDMLVQLDSFSLQAANGGEDGSVEFQFTLTVYEKSGGET